MRTFLVGLDGATFTVLDHLIERGLMPNLARFYEEGSRCTLRSTPIPITPQAWTTLATGRSAGHHGLHDFVRFDLGERGAFLRINSSRDISCETIWRRVSRHNRRVTLLNYFGTAPPEPIRGHVMPGFTSGRHLRRSSHPPDLFERLRDVAGLDVKVLGMDLDIERQGLQEMEPALWLDWIGHHVRREQAWFAVLEHLVTREPSDLTAVVFDGVDKIQHLAYPFLDPSLAPATPDAWESEVIAACHRYFGEVDRFLGRIRELAGDWSRIFIVSDHGFTASTEIFYVNTWLHEQGYLHWKHEVPTDSQQANYSASLGNDANSIDIGRSRAYALSPSTNGIYLNVPEADLERFRNELMERLQRLTGPDGDPVVTGVQQRETCLPGPFLERIPHLILTLRDHGFISVLNGKDAVVQRRCPLGTHHPEGILLGLGPGIRRGERLRGCGLLDVAPLLLHSLGLEIPAEYEGAVPDQIFEPACLAGEPPRIAEAEHSLAEALEPASADAHGGEMEAEDQAIVLDRLRSLGYVE